MNKNDPLSGWYVPAFLALAALLGSLIFTASLWGSTQLDSVSFLTIFAGVWCFVGVIAGVLIFVFGVFGIIYWIGRRMS